MTGNTFVINSEKVSFLGSNYMSTDSTPVSVTSFCLDSDFIS